MQDGNTSQSLPLEGIRIVDFSRLLPGPWCTQFLGDLGASVIKVEMPTFGDLSRHNAPRVGDSSVYFELVNGGKRSLSLDLVSAEGKEIAHRLIERADVVVESFRPAVAKKLGIGYDEVRALRPDVVYCSITGFGQTGPLSHISGHDLVIQSVAGYMPLVASNGALPPMPAFQAADYAGASMACTAVLAALMRRQRDGVGCYIDLAMFDSLFSMCNIALTGAIGTMLKDDDGTRLEAWGANPRYSIYETADGKPVSVALLEPRLWSAFCDAIGRPDLADPDEAPDARHTSHGERSEEYRRVISEFCRAHNRDDLVDRMVASGVPICPIYSPEEALRSKNVDGRNLIDDARGPEQPLPHITNPLVLSGLARTRRDTAPQLGADNAGVLGELGYGEDDLERLRREGVIGS